MNDVGPVAGGGNYLPVGEYVVDAVDLKTFNGDGGMFSILEFDVIESANPSVRSGRYSWVKRFDTEHDRTRGMSVREIKAFICLLVDLKNPGANASQTWTEMLPHEQQSPGIVTKGDQFGAWAYQIPSPAVGTRWFVRCWHKPPGARSAPNAKGVDKMDWDPMQPGETRGLQPAQQQAQAGGAPWA